MEHERFINLFTIIDDFIFFSNNIYTFTSNQWIKRVFINTRDVFSRDLRSIKRREFPTKH